MSLTPIGTKCKIITNPYNNNGTVLGHSGHYFPIGTIVYIINHDGFDADARMAAEYADGHDYWYINENDIEVIE